MTEEEPRASLSDRQARGGVIGGKGYGFQAAYIVSRIPTWLADPGFAAFLQEGAGDVDVLFQRPDGEERWYVQVKNYPVKRGTAREVFAAFLKTDRGSPGTYTRFTLACPGLHDDLRRLRSAVEELRGAAPIYRSGQHQILANTWEDLEALVTSLNLDVDARFLVDKVRFDTDLAGLTDDASLRRLFVGGLLERGDWQGGAPAGLFRAYEKLALLCHQAEALRQIYSREDVEAKIREALSEVPTTPDELWAVPFIWNPDFVGREEDLARLHQALSEEAPASGEHGRPAGTRPVGLIGMGGIGKTQMAIEYAYRYADAYPGGVFWINAAEPLAQGFAQLGRRLRPETAERPREEQVRAAAGYLRQHPETLLILDNLGEPAGLNRPVSMDLVPAGLPCRVLFTTRRRDLDRFTAIEVTELPQDEALRLLLRHPSRQLLLNPDHPEHEEARQICATLGYLPLALELAAAHLGRREKVPVAAYQEELLARGALGVLDDPRAGIKADDLPTRHEAAVASTLASQWEGLERVDARLLLRVAGQLPEAALIPSARLGLLAGLDDQEGGFFGSPLELALEELESASLVEELRDGQVRLHPLVREFAARLTGTAERAAFRRRCAANLAAAYEDVATLERHCARRGIDTLEQDLLTALVLLPIKAQDSGGETRSGIEDLLRILQRESHTLRGWVPGQRPGVFAQQLHYRAATLGLGRLDTGGNRLPCRARNTLLSTALAGRLRINGAGTDADGP